jgi:type II secretory pathway component PulF
MTIPYFTNRVSFTEKLLFTKRLSTMVKAGITVDESIQVLAEQTKSPYFHKVLVELRTNIENGQSLASSLEDHPNIFDQLYISLIQIGEESGTLEENLEFLSDQMSKENALRKKVQSAMLYPGLVLTAVSLMGGVISFFVLPQLVGFFDSFGADLPISTKILLFFANIMKAYGILILGGVFALVIALVNLSRTKTFKPFFHAIYLKIPLVGEMIRMEQLTRFSRNLGVLLESGVPISDALKITAKTLSNVQFQKAVKSVEKSVKEGKKISSAMEDKKLSMFPPIVVKMIGVGERTGKLDEILLYLGDYYDDEIDNISKNLTTILEPMLLIGIGIVVAFVALAIISPIYELTGSIRRQ